MDSLRLVTLTTPIQLSALRKLCERAYLANPVRTEIDLLAMGLRDLATELQHDTRVGRLAETAGALEPESLAFQCPSCRQAHGAEDPPGCVGA